MSPSTCFLLAAWTCLILSFHPKMGREAQWDLRTLASALAIACILTHALSRL